MLMGARDGAAGHRILSVASVAKYLKPSPIPGFRPTAVLAIYVLPAAETVGQVAPRNAGPMTLNHRFDEQSVVARGRSNMALATRQQVTNTLPLVFPQGIPAHRPSAPEWRTSYESKTLPRRNPLGDDRP